MNPDNIREVLRYTNVTPLCLLNYRPKILERLLKKAYYEDKKEFIDLLLKHKFVSKQQIEDNYWIKTSNTRWSYDVTKELYSKRGLNFYNDMFGSHSFIPTVILRKMFPEDMSFAIHFIDHIYMFRNRFESKYFVKTYRGTVTWKYRSYEIASEFTRDLYEYEVTIKIFLLDHQMFRFLILEIKGNKLISLVCNKKLMHCNQVCYISEVFDASILLLEIRKICMKLN